MTSAITSAMISAILSVMCCDTVCSNLSDKDPTSLKLKKHRIGEIQRQNHGFCPPIVSPVFEGSILFSA